MSEILIRKAVKGDAKGVMETFNDGVKRGFYKYTGTNAPRDAKDLKKWNKEYSKKIKNMFTFIAIDKSSGKVVGTCSFGAREKGRLRHRGDLGWGVRQDYARKGIATMLLKAVIKEAKRLGYKRVEAEAAVENVGSIRLAKKCGFKIEGRKKSGILLDDGRYADTYVLGRLI